MTDEEIEAILPKLDSVISYIDSIKEYCLKKALEGKKWRGYKVVESVTKRKLSDEDAVAKIISDNVYDPFAPEKLLSISELQKMLGKTQFNDLFGSYIIKPKGQAVLASVLQVAFDAGAKKILITISSAIDIVTVLADLFAKFQLSFYSSPEDAVIKALGIE